MIIPLAIFFILIGVSAIFTRPDPSLLTPDEKARLFDQTSRSNYPYRIIFIGAILGAYFLFKDQFSDHPLLGLILFLFLLLINRAIFTWLNYQKIKALNLNPAYMAKLRQGRFIQTLLLILFFAYILVDVAYKLHRYHS